VWCGHIKSEWVMTSKILRLPPWLVYPFLNIWVTNDHGHVPCVVIIIPSFPFSWLISGCVTRILRRVLLVKQELVTFPEHLSSSPVFCGVVVVQSLVFCVLFCRSLFVLFLLAIVLSSECLVKYLNFYYSDPIVTERIFHHKYPS
jgi:hypothetical protein